MQTYLTERLDHINWLTHTFTWMDSKRLFNQLNECKVISKAIDGAKAWSFHPAVDMWRGHKPALCRYTYIVAHTLQERSLLYDDSIMMNMINIGNEPGRWPSWFLCDDFFNAHRSNLIRKNERHYCNFWPNVIPSDVYIWPKLDDNRWILRRKQVGAKKYLNPLLFNPYVDDL